MWKKIGKIFDLNNKAIFKDLIYAQAPQTVIFENRIRFYFSTRSVDIYGKYISHIAYVDMSKDFKNIIKISDHEIIPLGDLGCFDEHGIFPMNVLVDENKFYAFTCGWYRKSSVSVDTGIGYAISEDKGETFKKFGGGPVLSANINEPFLVGDPFVIKEKDEYYMWYIYGLQWKTYEGEDEPQRIYRIAQAKSKDCITWYRDSRLILNVCLDDESQALPTVIKSNSRYHMVFCYRYSNDFRKNASRGYRLGYAYSDDLINWVRDDGFVAMIDREDSWDAHMKCYPHLFKMDGEIFLAYNGNEFGKSGFGVAKYIGSM